MMMDELVETVLDEASSRVLSDMSSESSHSDAEESDAPKFVRQDVPLPESRGVCVECARDGKATHCQEISKVSMRFAHLDPGDVCYRCMDLKQSCSWGKGRSYSTCRHRPTLSEAN